MSAVRGWTKRQRRGVLLAGALTTLVVACEGGNLASPDGPNRSASVALAISMQASSGGGEADAYNVVDGVDILIRAQDGSTLFHQRSPFDSKGSETRVPVSVPVDGEVQGTLETTLFRGTDPLFTGTTSLRLSPNEVTVADLVLVPVGAGISVPDTLPPLVSVGETQLLPGEVLFATGDVAGSLHLTWTSLTPDVVTIQGSGASSSVVAVGPGAGRLQASYGSFTAPVGVSVHLVTAQVDVQPPTSSIAAGGTVQLTAVARDAGGTAIPGRTATWSTSDASVATVDTTGLVTGTGLGTVTISAMVDGVEGDATVQVTAVPPIATVSRPTNVGPTSARLVGMVDPQGGATTAWFEWGSDPKLATYTETSPISVGSGTGAVEVTADVSGLAREGAYYYRVVASNTAAQVQSSIQAFRTQPPAPSGLYIYAGEIGGSLLYWTDNSTSELSFQVERSSTSATGGFSVVLSVGRDTTSADDPGPFPTQNVYYRVRACNATTCSPPSNVVEFTASAPYIWGTLTLCYGAGSCTGFSGQTVQLSGAATGSTTSGTYGGYYFYSLKGGETYTVSVSDVSCFAKFRTNAQTVTPGWGESVQVDFYADTVLCGAPLAARDASPFDPVVASFLGLDGPAGARARPSPR